MEGWAGGVFLLLLDSDNLAVGVHGVYVGWRLWLSSGGGWMERLVFCCGRS
jgi:hypothetical protein